MTISVSDEDLTLLRQYATDRDPDAFEGLARRHAPWVYGVAYRITGSRHDAEDIAQACMLELAHKATKIHTSLVGWLHRLAMHRAQNAIRGQRTRRRHEAAAAIPATSTAAEADWGAIESQIDVALAALPDDLREPLVLHYLRGLSQVEVAQALGLSQPTVSRRLGTGVAQLREGLRALGIGVALVALQTLLPQAQATTIPATLQASLGKLAIAGIGPRAPSNSFAIGKRSWLWVTRSAFVALIAATGAWFGWGSRLHTTVIPHPPRLQWGALHDGNSTFIGALAAAAKASGKDTTYTRLMGDTGLAFATRWYRRDVAGDLSWNGLASFGDGNMEMSLMEAALGIQLHHAAFFGWTLQDSGPLIPTISQSIQVGSPVIAQDGPRLRCCLVVGYDDWNPRRVLVQHYGDAEAHWEFLTQQGGLAWIEPASNPALSRPQAIEAALRKGVADWTRSSQVAGVLGAGWTEADATLFFGAEAFEEWSHDTDRSRTVSELQARQIWEASWWNYDLYCDARYQAVRYLREAAGEFSGPAASAMLRAASIYERLETEHLVDSVYLRPEGPWTAKTFADWTPEVRRAEIELFRTVAKLEASAIAALSESLRLISLTPSSLE